MSIIVDGMGTDGCTFVPVSDTIALLTVKEDIEIKVNEPFINGFIDDEGYEGNEYTPYSVELIPHLATSNTKTYIIHHEGAKYVEL